MHRSLFGASAARKDFERLVSALVRAGLVLERDDRFERDGKTVEFRRLHLSASGLQVRSVRGVRVAVVPEGNPRNARTKAPGVAELEAAADPQLVEQLRAWRADEARRRRVPAFRVLTDRTLYGLASARPTNGMWRAPPVSSRRGRAMYSPDVASMGTAQEAETSQVPQSSSLVESSNTHAGWICGRETDGKIVATLRAPSPPYQPSR